MEPSKMQQHPKKKQGNHSSRAFQVGLAVVIVAGVAYRFWPKAEGLWQKVSAAVVSNEVSLTGILYTQDNPLAIVDGKIVHEGDTIGGVRILKIHKDDVEFERSGRQWSQRMRPLEEGVVYGLPVLVQLGSPRCSPCRRMMPILDELRTKYSNAFKVRYIDLGKNETAGMKYGVRAIPTQIFYDNKGREVYRHVGFYSKKDILATWKYLGVEL